MEIGVLKPQSIWIGNGLKQSENPVFPECEKALPVKIAALHYRPHIPLYVRIDCFLLFAHRYMNGFGFQYLWHVVLQMVVGYSSPEKVYLLSDFGFRIVFVKQDLVCLS